MEVGLIILLLILNIISFILGFKLISHGLITNQVLFCFLGILLTGILFGMIWWLFQKESIKHYNKTCFVCNWKQQPHDLNLCCLKCQSCCQCSQKQLSPETLELIKLQKEKLKKLEAEKKMMQQLEKEKLKKLEIDKKMLQQLKKEKEKTKVKKIQTWKQQSLNQPWKIHQKEIQKREGRVATITEYLEWEKARKNKNSKI